MKTIKRTLGMMIAGLAMASANAAIHYTGSWEVSRGAGGLLSLDIDGSWISGRLTDREWFRNTGEHRTGVMTGSVTGRRFKVTVSYSDGSSSTFQGNIEFDRYQVHMNGLRYVGPRADGDTRFSVSATR